MFKYHPGQGTDVQGVHLDDIPGQQGPVVPGLAHCVGSGAAALVHPYAGAQGLFEDTPGLELGEDPSGHGRGHLPPLAAQQGSQNILPPAGKPLPQRHHRLR